MYVNSYIVEDINSLILHDLNLKTKTAAWKSSTRSPKATALDLFSVYIPVSELDELTMLTMTMNTEKCKIR